MIIRLAIVGAGGLGREVLWTARRMSELNIGASFSIVGFYDDAPQVKSEIWGVPILGIASHEALQKGPNSPTHYICAIGNNESREKVSTRLDRMELQPLSIIDPTVLVGPDVYIGAGTYIAAGCILSPNARLGSHVVVNHGSSVGHDSITEDFAQVCPGGRISGNAHLGKGAFIGSNSVVAPGVNLGAWSTLGANSLANRQIPPHTTALGIPAKVIYSKPVDLTNSAEGL